MGMDTNVGVCRYSLNQQTLCRDENRTIAEYALRDMSKPIGVSEYHLCTDLPLDLKNALPDPKEIRSRIDMKK